MPLPARIAGMARAMSRGGELEVRVERVNLDDLRRLYVCSQCGEKIADGGVMVRGGYPWCIACLGRLEPEARGRVMAQMARLIRARVRA